MFRVALVVGLLGCGARAHTKAGSSTKGDDITLYRDAALIRQRVELDLPATPTTIKVMVAVGVRADQVMLLERGGLRVTGIHAPTDPNATLEKPEPMDAVDEELDEPVDPDSREDTEEIGEEDETPSIAPVDIHDGKPVELRLDVVAPRAGRYALVLGYVTDRLDWDVAYTMTANPSRDRAIVRGALAVRNRSGIPIHAAAARVIDAELGAWRGKSTEQLAASLVGGTQSSTPPAEARELGPLELGAGETRVEIVGAITRSMSAVLVYDPIGSGIDKKAADPDTDPQLGATPPAAPRVSESFEVTRVSGGTAGLPAGPARLLEARSDGSLGVLGEARLFDASSRVASIDTIAVGTAELVTGKRERRELTVDEENKRVTEEFLITLDNQRSYPVGVLVREHLYRGQNWSLAYHSALSAAKEGPQQVSMRVRVPPKSKTKLLYVVVYNWALSAVHPRRQQGQR